jgi:hypothetical protein
MNNNFDLKKFLAEGKLLKENTNSYTEVIENLFKTFKITDLKTFNEELNYSDLVDAMCEEMGGDTTNVDDMVKARDILKKYATDKFQNSTSEESLPIEGELIGDTFEVDFDDIGNYWHDKFVEKYGYSPDDLNDDDNDKFDKIQDDVMQDFESKLANKYGKLIKIKFNY